MSDVLGVPKAKMMERYDEVVAGLAAAGKEHTVINALEYIAATDWPVEEKLVCAVCMAG